MADFAEEQKQQNDPEIVEYDETKFPYFNEWNEMYSNLKNYCTFPDCIEFVKQHPETINYRRGGIKGNTILHQAAFWGVDHGVLEQLLELGSMPHLKNFKNQTPAMLADAEGKMESAKSVREVFGDEREGDDHVNRDAMEIIDYMDNNLITLHSEHFTNLTREMSITELSNLLMKSCYKGDFALCVALLKEFPFLSKHQSMYTGWTALHQAGYHGCGANLYRRLIELGVPQNLLTFDGKTWIMIALEENPNKYNKNGKEDFFEEFTVTTDNDENNNLNYKKEEFKIGDLVRMSRANVKQAYMGNIVFIDDNNDITIREKKTIKQKEVDDNTTTFSYGQVEEEKMQKEGEKEKEVEKDMKFYTGPIWRVNHVIVYDDEGDYDDNMKELLVECCTCGDYILPHAASPTCNNQEGSTTNPHYFCSECLCNSLWASWTNSECPLLCQFCKNEIDLNHLRKQRGMTMKWHATQNMSFNEFIKNVHKKLTELKGAPIKWQDLDNKTRELFEKQIQDGVLMRCLNEKCGQTFTRNGGCSYVRCFFCKTEHCWNTKQIAGKGPGQCGGGHGCHY